MENATMECSEDIKRGKKIENLPRANLLKFLKTGLNKSEQVFTECVFYENFD